MRGEGDCFFAALIAMTTNDRFLVIERDYPNAQGVSCRKNGKCWVSCLNPTYAGGRIDVGLKSTTQSSGVRMI